MYSLNQSQIIGYVTEDPQVREIGSGMLVTDLNIEIKTKTDNPNANNPMGTTFLNVTLWSKLAEIARDYVKKGSQVYLSGRLETDSWEDDKGNKKFKTKMVADNLIMLSPKDGFLAPLSDNLLISGGINKAEILGNVTKTPELKTTPSGSNVTSFGVATNRVWKNSSGEKQEKTEFHNIVAWDDLADQIAKHIAKGRKVYVSGRIQTRSWETPDGQKRYTTEIVANELKSLGHALEGGSKNSGNYITDQASSESNIAESIDNIPEINYESEIKPEDLPF